MLPVRLVRLFAISGAMALVLPAPSWAQVVSAPGAGAGTGTGTGTRTEPTPAATATAFAPVQVTVAPAVLPKLTLQTATHKTVIVLSGGVSLGSYEAGVTWITLRGMKKLLLENGGPDPVITGASAGAINALIAAVEWCSADPDRATDNLFFTTWIGVGIDTLLPANATKFVDAPPTRDGLFQRAALQPAEQDIVGAMKKRKFRRCDVPLGIVVSKQQAQTLTIGMDRSSVTAPVQRFAVTLRASSAAGQPLTTQQDSVDVQALNRTALLGVTLRLAAPRQVIRDDDLTALLEAASAFPVAFGPRSLGYYCDPNTTEECRDAASDQLFHAPFFDGGLYDNIPLGLGAVLAGNAAPTVRYVDPDLRRHAVPARPDAKTRPVPEDWGLAGANHWFELAGTFIDVARKSELQSVRRSGVTATLRSATRFAPVVGDLLLNMGAFLARDFRVFDYAAGVYDGLYSLREADCPGAGVVQAECIAVRVAEDVQDLALGAAADDADINYVLQELFRGEMKIALADSFDRVMAHPHIKGWLDVHASGRCPIEKITAESLQIGQQDPTRGSSSDLVKVQSLADAVGQCPLGTVREQDRPFFRDPSGWAARTALRAVERLGVIEQEDRELLKEHDPTTSRTIGEHLLPVPAFALRLMSRQHPEPGFAADGSSIPTGHAAWHLVPYSAAVNVVHGGGELGWQPMLHLGAAASFALPVEVGWRPAPSATAYVRGSLSLALRTGWWVLSSVQFGPSAALQTPSWSTAPADTSHYGSVGGEGSVGGIYDILKVSVVYERDALGSGWVASGFLGVTDLNGVIFWGSRVGSGAGF
jgi:Patatin-like phospholipase